MHRHLDSIHLLVSFQVFKWLYLVQYWPDLHHSWEFCKLGVLFLTMWVLHCLSHDIQTHTQPSAAWNEAMATFLSWGTFHIFTLVLNSLFMTATSLKGQHPLRLIKAFKKTSPQWSFNWCSVLYTKPFLTQKYEAGTNLLQAAVGCAAPYSLCFGNIFWVD